MRVPGSTVSVNQLKHVYTRSGDEPPNRRADAAANTTCPRSAGALPVEANPPT
jgi:hypothetical protein